jgi:hypothetical protein
MQKRLEFNLSLSEEDVKEYLQQVLREVKKQKPNNGEKDDIQQ